MMCFKRSAKHNKIDEAIKVDKKNFHRKIKLLLLGTGDSGKSTFTKQVKVLYKGGFNEQEIVSYTDVILSRTMLSINAICNATQSLKITTSPKIQDIMHQLSTIPKLTPEAATMIKAVWSDEGIQQAFDRRNEYQLDSNAQYYFDNADRFSQPDFVPTTNDIFKVRHKTSGITETVFETNDLEIHLVDVGGQRSERRKWLHCFENVTAVLYFVSLEEYNMQLSEDYRVNRLQEALDLFEEITASKYFVNTHFFVLYNKEDLFRKKLELFPISDMFDDFTGSNSYENSLKYIQNQFESRFAGTRDRYIPFVTCGLDTEGIEKTFLKIQSLIKCSVHDL